MTLELNAFLSSIKQSKLFLNYDIFWKWTEESQRLFEFSYNGNIPLRIDLYYTFQAFFLTFQANNIETITFKRFYYSWCERLRRLNDPNESRYELLILNENDNQSQEIFKKIQYLDNKYRGIYNAVAADFSYQPLFELQQSILKLFMTMTNRELVSGLRFRNKINNFRIGSTGKIKNIFSIYYS